MLLTATFFKGWLTEDFVSESCVVSCGFGFYLFVLMRHFGQIVIPAVTLFFKTFDVI